MGKEANASSGELSEWLKVRLSKSRVPRKGHRGFKSHALREKSRIPIRHPAFHLFHFILLKSDILLRPQFQCLRVGGNFFQRIDDIIKLPHLIFFNNTVFRYFNQGFPDAVDILQ